MQVLFISRDLMFGSQIDGAARRHGGTYRLTGPEQVSGLPLGDAVVILDLGVAGVEVAALVGELRGADIPPRAIVAYAPHVHEQKLAAAREAGCDEVLTRGQFHGGLDALLQRYADSPAD